MPPLVRRIRVSDVENIHHVKGLVMRPYNTREIIERDRQSRSTGVGCSLSKNDIRTFASGANDQPPTLPRTKLRAPLTGNHGLVRSPTPGQRLKLDHNSQLLQGPQAWIALRGLRAGGSGHEVPRVTVGVFPKLQKERRRARALAVLARLMFRILFHAEIASNLLRLSPEHEASSGEHLWVGFGKTEDHDPA